jgi:phasin
MEKSDTPFEGVTAIVSQNIEQAAKAMHNYVEFVQKGISSTPWGKTDLSEKIKNNLEKNIATAFEHAQKLLSAKDIQDAVRIQTEFMQTQLQTLNEQAKDLGETATKAITDRFKGVSS